MSRIMILAMATVGLLGGLAACECDKGPKGKRAEADSVVHQSGRWHSEVMTLDVGDGVKCYLIKGTHAFSCVKVKL